MTSRDRIFQAAIDLLNEEPDVEAITVRRIAERADVGIGAINYHFQSKDHLLNEAVGALMQAEADKWIGPSVTEPIVDPEMRLRSLLKQTSQIGMRFPHLLEILVRFELEQGTFNVAVMVVPLLRELWTDKRSEADIRLAALQLITSIQVLFLRREEVTRFTGYRFEDATQLDQIIDRLIDNILCRAATGAKEGDYK